MWDPDQGSPLWQGRGEVPAPRSSALLSPARATRMVILGPEMMDVVQGCSLTLTVELQQDNGEIATSKRRRETAALSRKRGECQVLEWKHRMPRVAAGIPAMPRWPVPELGLPAGAFVARTVVGEPSSWEGAAMQCVCVCVSLGQLTVRTEGTHGRRASHSAWQEKGFLLSPVGD